MKFSWFGRLSTLTCTACSIGRIPAAVGTMRRMKNIDFSGNCSGYSLYTDPEEARVPTHMYRSHPCSPNPAGRMLSCFVPLHSIPLCLNKRAASLQIPVRLAYLLQVEFVTEDGALNGPALDTATFDNCLLAPPSALRSRMLKALHLPCQSRRPQFGELPQLTLLELGVPAECNPEYHDRGNNDCTGILALTALQVRYLYPGV